jgi:hypothetical protein
MPQGTHQCALANVSEAATRMPMLPSALTSGGCYRCRQRASSNARWFVVAAIMVSCCDGCGAEPLYDAVRHPTEVLEYYTARAAMGRTLDGLDLCGGCGIFTHALHQGGKASYLFDESNPQDDLTTREGFFKAERKVLQVKRKGLVLAGPPCSLFVWLSSMHHRRNAANPWGNEKYSRVLASNVVASNVCLLLLLCSMRGVAYLMEQPLSSWLPKPPIFQQVFAWSAAARVVTNMKQFGHVNMKPTVLWSNMGSVAMLKGPARTRKKAPLLPYRRKSGYTRGRPLQLRRSAMYPLRFVKAAWRANGSSASPPPLLLNLQVPEHI